MSGDDFFQYAWKLQNFLKNYKYLEILKSVNSFGQTHPTENTYYVLVHINYSHNQKKVNKTAAEKHVLNKLRKRQLQI